MDAIAASLLIGQRILYLIVAIFGIGFLIGFHELGHFLFCKLFGIRTPSFSIGFGPKLFSKKIGGTEFLLSAIPLGGFVEIAGTAEVGQGKQEYAQSMEHDSFAIKPFYQKFLVMIGGIAFNLLFAFCTFIILVLAGIPKTMLLYPENLTSVVKTVEPNSSASQAGIQPGDRIQSINNVVINDDVPSLITTIHTLANQTVPLSITRNGEIKELLVTIAGKTVGTKTIGSLGVSFEVEEIIEHSLLGALKHSAQLTYGWIKKTAQGFLNILRQHDLSGVGGPIIIISMLSYSALASIKVFLLLLAIISINLAVLNIIPLPILDGGQLLFSTIEAIIRRPLPLKIREYIHIVSWILILLLLLYLSIYDITRLASPHIEGLKRFLGFGR